MRDVFNTLFEVSRLDPYQNKCLLYVTEMYLHAVYYVCPLAKFHVKFCISKFNSTMCL